MRMFYILIVSVILLITLILLIYSGKKVEKYSSGEHVIAGNGDYSIKLSPLYLYFNKE